MRVRRAGSGRGGRAHRAEPGTGHRAARGGRVPGRLAGLLPRLRLPDRAGPGAARAAPGLPPHLGAGRFGGHRRARWRPSTRRRHRAGGGCWGGPRPGCGTPAASRPRCWRPASGSGSGRWTSWAIRATCSRLAPGSATRRSPATERFIEVVRPGPFAIVADLGRPGYGHLGVPRSGAADPDSLRLANRLVGNPEDAAAVELTLGGATLRFAGPAGSAPAWVAVTGAAARPGSAQPGSRPARQRARPGRRQRAGGAVRGAERGHADGGDAGHGGAQLSGCPGRRDGCPGAGQPFGGHAVRARAVAAATPGTGCRWAAR